MRSLEILECVRYALVEEPWFCRLLRFLKRFLQLVLSRLLEIRVQRVNKYVKYLFHIVLYLKGISEQLFSYHLVWIYDRFQIMCRSEKLNKGCSGSIGASCYYRNYSQPFDKFLCSFTTKNNETIVGFTQFNF